MESDGPSALHHHNLRMSYFLFTCRILMALSLLYGPRQAMIWSISVQTKILAKKTCKSTKTIILAIIIYSLFLKKVLECSDSRFELNRGAENRGAEMVGGGGGG